MRVKIGHLLFMLFLVSLVFGMVRLDFFRVLRNATFL